MILVTGASGLVGSHLLLLLLKKGNKVKALIRDEKSKSKIEKVFRYYVENAGDLLASIQWVRGDVTDVISLREAFLDVEKVYHCAAFISFDRKYLRYMKQVNTVGTANCVNLCLELKVKKLVHVSSIAAIGKPKKGMETTEHDKWPQGNMSAYSYTKTQSELEVWRGINEGLKAVIVNPSVILGPGNWESGSGKIFSQAYKGMKFYTKGSTGFVDVRDVVELMETLMESDIHSERYIVNEGNIHYRNLFTHIASAMGKKPPQWHATPILTSIAWRAEKMLAFVSGREPTLTRNSAKSAHAEQRYSSNKLKEQTGFKFREIEDTIKHTAQIFLLDVKR